VASCNNEGSITPNAIEEGLRQLAGVRFLSKLLRPGPAHDERPLYTPQSADYRTLQARFERNLEQIAQLAARQGVPLLLATLPVNLRYEGGIPGTLQARKDGALRSVVRECKAGDCAYDTTEPCVDEARSLIDAGQLTEGRAALEACDDLEALRSLGLLDHRAGDHTRARQLLGQYTELVPRGRCRPGLNQAIRATAAAHEGVTLVDLAAQAEAMSTDGIADPDLFVDNCHMSWVGYSLMADVVLEALTERGVVPAAGAAPAADAGWQHAQAAGLPPVVRTELIGGPVRSDEPSDPRDPWGERPGRGQRP
jgi:lysophospholipase L1-like esterase